MKKYYAVILSCIMVASCNAYQSSENRVVYIEPLSSAGFEDLARNVTVVKHSPFFVIYEYKNIRVDELGAVAALYCQDQNRKQAVLYDINLHQNNSRRATFMCKAPSEN